MNFVIAMVERVLFWHVNTNMIASELARFRCEITPKLHKASPYGL